MRIRPRSGWRKRFAWLPIKLEGEWHWLCRFWSKPEGEYVRVELQTPFMLRPENAFVTANFPGSGEKPFVKVQFQSEHELWAWYTNYCDGVIP